MAHGFEYRDSDHSYWLEGRQIPGVTSVLRWSGRIDDRWFSEESRNRGSAVHAACRLLLEDDLDESTVDPRIAGYVDAFRAFLRESRFSAIVDKCEVPICDPDLGFGGTPDIFGTVRSLGNCIIDIKTGQPQDYHGLQLAGYKILAEKNYDLRLLSRYGLHLKQNGRYTLTEYDEITDENTFIAELSRMKAA